MIMNIRASIWWPAGGVEFGFRPNIYVQRLHSAADPPAPTRVANDVAPAAKASAENAEGAVPRSAVEAPHALPQPPPAQQVQPAEPEAPPVTAPPAEATSPLDPAAPAPAEPAAPQ
jgi:hypothetical protein